MKITRKTLYIIGAILVVLILVGVISTYLKQRNNPQSPVINTIDEAAKLKADELKTYTDYQNKLAVVYAKNIENCKTLIEADEIDECYYNIAVQAKRKDYCEKISLEKTKLECLDSLDYYTYSWGSDPNLCGNLEDAILKNSCYNEYFAKLSNVSDCESVTDNTLKTKCQDTVNNRLATVFNQPEACGLISDQATQANCKKNITVLPKDSDNDGLPDDVEMSFGTDPFKADTNGDGISDYDSINKYHIDPVAKKGSN